MVLNGDLDLAITAIPVEDEGALTVMPLFRHPLCVLVPRSGPWPGRTSVDPAELAEHPLLIYNEDFSLSRQLMQLFADSGFTPRIAVRSGQWDFLAAMVQGGVGIAVLPEPICRKLDQTTLMWLPLNSNLSWQLGMIWREGVYISQSARRGLIAAESSGRRLKPARTSGITLSRSAALPAGRDRAGVFAESRC